MPSWKKIIQSGSKADLTHLTASKGLVVDNIDGGDVKFTIANSNADSGMDKSSGIYFKHAYGNDSSDLRDAGKIISTKQSLYGVADTTAISALRIYTGGGAVGDVQRVMIYGGQNIGTARVGIGFSDSTTTLPVDGLTVNGNISASGIVYASQFLTSSIAGTLPVDGNITAGGYISASGFIKTDTNITASGNIQTTNLSASGFISASKFVGDGSQLTNVGGGGSGGSGIFAKTGSKYATTNAVEITGSLLVSGSSTFTNIGLFNQTGDTTISGSNINLVPRTGEVFTFRAGDFVQIKKPTSGVKEVQISGSLKVSGSNTVKIEGPTSLTGSFEITDTSDANFRFKAGDFVEIKKSPKKEVQISGSLKVSGSNTFQVEGPTELTGSLSVVKPDSQLIVDDTGISLSSSMTRITGSMIATDDVTIGTGVQNFSVDASTGTGTFTGAVIAATSSTDIVRSSKFLPKEITAEIGSATQRISKLYMRSEIDTSGSLVINFHSGSTNPQGLVISASEASMSDSVFSVNVVDDNRIKKEALYVSSSGNVKVGVGMQAPDQDFSNAGNTRLGVYGNQNQIIFPADIGTFLETSTGLEIVHLFAPDLNQQSASNDQTASIQAPGTGLHSNTYVWQPYQNNDTDGTQVPLQFNWMISDEWYDANQYTIATGSILTGSGFDGEAMIFTASEGDAEQTNPHQYWHVQNTPNSTHYFGHSVFLTGSGMNGEFPTIPTDVSRSLTAGAAKWKITLEKTGGSGPNQIFFTSSDAFTIDLPAIDSGMTDYMMGDVNKDGQVDILDLVQIANHILGSNLLTGESLQLADYNGDGNVNVNDMVQITNVVLGVAQTYTAMSYDTGTNNQNFIQESDTKYYNALNSMSASLNNSAISATQRVAGALAHANEFIKNGYRQREIKHPVNTMIKRDGNNPKLIYPLSSSTFIQGTGSYAETSSFNSLNGVVEGSTLVINHQSFMVEEVNSSSPVTSVLLDRALPSGSISGSTFTHFPPKGFFKNQKAGSFDGSVTNTGFIIRQGDNRIGVGTSRPQALLHISGSSGSYGQSSDDLLKVTNKDNINVVKVSKDSELVLRNAVSSSLSASFTVDTGSNLNINDTFKVNHKDVRFKSGSKEVIAIVNPTSGQISFEASDGARIGFKGAEREYKTADGKIITKVQKDGVEFIRSGSATTNQIQMQQNVNGAFISVSGSQPGYNIIRSGTADKRLIRENYDLFITNGGNNVWTAGMTPNGSSGDWYSISPGIGHTSPTANSPFFVSGSGLVGATSMSIGTDKNSGKRFTVEGDISQSGNFLTQGHISSSGGINAGTTGTTLANTGHISSSQYDLGGYYNGSNGFSHQELWRFSSSAQSNEGQAANLEMYMSGVRVNKLTTEIGGTSFFGAGTNAQKFGFNAGTAPQDVGITVGGQISASGNLEIDGNATIDGVLTATRKSFLIPHPTDENKQLQYASLEGPENGVYIRGKLKRNNIIELPHYWSELIDEDTISVSLTPIGRFQYLYVRDIDSKEIMVGIDKGSIRNIYCHYVIYAERKDIDKLEVEITDG